VSAACRRLGVEPAHVAVFETTGAGIEAARAAGAGLVVCFDRSDCTEELHAHSCDLVLATSQRSSTRRSQLEPGRTDNPAAPVRRSYVFEISTLCGAAAWSLGGWSSRTPKPKKA
jgi:hypothetical protein